MAIAVVVVVTVGDVDGTSKMAVHASADHSLVAEDGSHNRQHHADTDPETATDTVGPVERIDLAVACGDAAAAADVDY